MKCSVAIGVTLALAIPASAGPTPATPPPISDELVQPASTDVALGHPDEKPAEPETTMLEEKAKPSKSSKSSKSSKKSKKKKKRKYRTQPPSVDVTTTNAWKYGQLKQEECEAELTKRGIGFTSEPTKGVMAGVRLNGPIRGVTFRTRQSEEKRATSTWEIADCRLVLALDDFAEVLVAHDVVEVRHYSMHRKAPDSWPAGKVGSQHFGGMAIDAAIFTTKDGTKMDVLDDWHGRIGGKTCGDGGVPRKKTDKSLALRAILCETAAKRIFNVILTPNHNRAHRNHFHLDVTPGAKWFVID